MADKYYFNGEYTSNNLKLLYEDNHVISVVKPIHVLSQADGSDKTDMLSLIKKDISFREEKPGDAFVGLVHRLDANTCGTMVFAKTSKCASRLSEQIRNRKFYKGYFAVVSGSLKEESGYLKDYLSKDEKNNRVYRDKNGRECILYYEKIEEKNNKTLVCAYPITGRTHQIRAQFAFYGHPLTGDIKYGGGRSDTFSLWSFVCGFHHPTKGNEIMIMSFPEEYGDFVCFDKKSFTGYGEGLSFEKLENIKGNI